MAKLILLRHGQSVWNKKDFFTGWVDIPLSPKGIEEAVEAGEKIKHLPIDIIYTSTLIRSIMTAMLAMSLHDSGKTPVVMHQGEGKMEDWSQIYNPAAQAELIPLIKAWELNERMYGELQGLNKEETRQKFGADQVKIWRRSFDVPPPKGESLKMTSERSIPYFQNVIVPQLKEGKNVFVSAHGNSLRSIMMFLDKLTKEQVLELELATGKPVVYNYQNGHFTKELI